MTAPEQTSGRRPTVAIIGSGSAGAVAAYRLRQLLGPGARLLVLEREPRVGGRARSVEVGGARVEVGGTLIHSSNRRLGDLMQALGLARTAPDLELDGRDETLAVWDGQRVIFRARTASAPFAWALLRAFGLRDLRRLRAHCVEVLGAWQRVYERQDAGPPCESPRALLAAVGLGPAVEVSLRELLGRAGARDGLVRGLAEPILRNMYNQDATINGFAGTIALIGGGFAGGQLYSVAGGNASLFERAIEASGAELHLGRAVRSIRRQTSDRAALVVEDGAGGAEVVDATVVAAPLEDAGIDLPSPVRSPARAYRTVHTTLVVGELDPAFLGLPPGSRLPSHVLTTASAGDLVRSIGVTGWSPAHRSRIYKIFSGLEVTSSLLDRLFVRTHEVERVVWQAYPVLEPAPDLPDFEIDDRVWHVNGFESAVSALETQAVAGWEVAGLVAARLAGSSTAGS